MCISSTIYTHALIAFNAMQHVPDEPINQEEQLRNDLK